MRVDDPSLRTPQRADNPISDIELEFSHLVSREPLERNVSNLVFSELLGSLEEFVEVFRLALRVGEYELAYLTKGDPLFSATSVEEVSSPNAECRFERSRGIVDSRMNDFAVPARRLLSDLTVPTGGALVSSGVFRRDERLLTALRERSSCQRRP